MFSIANLGSSLATLTTPNIHPHGHKHGALGSAGEGASDTAAQIPAATAQNLFGGLLTSLEQVIGLQTPSETTVAAAPGAASSAPELNGAGSSAAASTAQSTSSLLKNYLNNLSQNPDGSSLTKLAGSNLDSKV